MGRHACFVEFTAGRYALRTYVTAKSYVGYPQASEVSGAHAREALIIAPKNGLTSWRENAKLLAQASGAGRVGNLLASPASLLAPRPCGQRENCGGSSVFKI